MKRTALFLTLSLASCAGSASADPPGLNLSWDDCVASVGGGLNQASTCQSNTEAHKNLYGTYILPSDPTEVEGNEVVIDLCTNSATLPCWWNFSPFSTRSGFTGLNFWFAGGGCPNNGYDYWSAFSAASSSRASSPNSSRRLPSRASAFMPITTPIRQTPITFRPASARSCHSRWSCVSPRRWVRAPAV
jgi:hypothetical protein